MQKSLDLKNNNGKGVIGKEPSKHLIRSILILIDNTKSMKMKDFKPSRIALTVMYLEKFINKVFDINPIVYIAIAVAQQQLCHVLVDFTNNNKQLFKKLEMLEVNEKGNFSLENCIKTAIQVFENVPLYSNKQILLIQSSPSTKDYGDIFKAIHQISCLPIRFNIISLVGITTIFQKLAKACSGIYQTVSNQDSYYKQLSKLAISPPFDPKNVQKALFKVTFCKKEIKDYAVYCYCHMEEKTEIFVCLVCYAKLCKVPTICFVCQSHVIFPGDLARHQQLPPE